MFLKQKMDAAQGFIDAVKQRQNTLMTTMQAIIDLHARSSKKEMSRCSVR